MRIKKITGLQALSTTLVLIGMYLVGWVVLPTICTLPRGTEIKYGILKYFFEWYTKYPELYIVISVFFGAVISILLCVLISYATKKKVSNVYTEKEIQIKYTEFLQDADELFIVGGDLDFLINCGEQRIGIERLGNKCKILFGDFNQSEKQKKLKELYKKLCDKGICLGIYNEKSDDFKNIRGQIKVCKDGTKSCLFVNSIPKSNGTKKYEVINLKNQFMIEILLKSFRSVYDSSRNPLVKHILFDIGGVYFDGDFEKDFLEKINAKLSQHIQSNRSSKLLLDKELNLGKKSITEWVESKIARRLNPDEREYIERIWTSSWKPNPKMKDLVRMIKKSGYKVGMLSNMDELNGGVYNDNGYFAEFPIENRFLSYERGITKPDRGIFELVLKELDLKPYEVLFIDDHEDNISMAHSLGFETIQFSLKDDSNLKGLKNNLKEHCINVFDYKE